MKLFGGCILCLALRVTGCVEMPLLHGDQKPVQPAARAVEKPVTSAAVRPEEVTPTNAHEKAEALDREMDSST